MRGVFVIIALSVLVSCNGNKARSGEHIFETPIEYNDFIVDQQNVIIHHMIDLSHSYDSGDSDTIRMAFESLVNACDSSKALIDILTPYEGDSSLKISSRNLFNFYSSIFHKEYREMLDIFLKGELASDAEVAELNRIVVYVRDKEDILNQELTKAQQEFAKKEGFKFEGNLIE
jgi:hypothetical protein